MKTILVSTLLVCLAASLVSGAVNPSKVLEEKVTLSAVDLPAGEALKPISEKLGMTILVDETIKEKINANLTDLPLSTVLNTLCAPKKWTWRVAYLPAAATASQAQVTINAMGNLSLGSAIIQEPGTGKTTAVLVNLEPEKVKLAELAEALGLKPVIVIAGPKQAAVAERKKDSNRVESHFGPPKGQPEVAATTAMVPPVGGFTDRSQVQNMAKQMVGQFQNLPMDQQMQLMHDMRRAWFEGIPQDQRDQMMQQMRQQFGNRNQNGGGRPGRRQQGGRPNGQ